MNIIINNSGNRSLIEKLIELLPNVSVLREEDYKNNLDEYLSDVRDFIKYGCSYYPTNDNETIKYKLEGEEEKTVNSPLTPVLKYK